MKKRPWDDKWETKQPSLSSGGQGTTYIVTDRDSAGEQAILKLLKNQKSPQARRRMHSEVTNLKIVGAAKGKVPHVLDGNTDRFDEEKIPLYFVMEYIPGPTLNEIVESDGPMSLDQALSVVRDLSFTIEVAHQEGVIHRDLKPQNIVVRDSDRPDVFIVDYGLSFNEEQGDVTLTGETIGNRFLTLPEGNVVGENRRDPRSELTLLCGILYYCLSATEPRQLQDSQGKSPHRRIGLMDKLDDPRAPRLELFFDRGLFPHIDNRFQTVQEFKTQLDQLMSSEEQAFIEDPRKTAARASRKLVEGNRQLQLESFKPHANKFLSAIPTYVTGNLSDQMGEFELTTHWHSGHLKLPPDLEQIPNVNAAAVHVKVKLHPQRRGVLYAVGVRGTNLVVCRTELLFDNQGGLTDGGDWVELFSYPSDQEIHPKLAIQDLQRFINRTVVELQEVISEQG